MTTAQDYVYEYVNRKLKSLSFSKAVMTLKQAISM